MTDKKIPLAERMRGKTTGRKLPTAMGLYAEDFFAAVGEITGLIDRYEEIYELHIKPYEDTNGEPQSVQELGAPSGGSGTGAAGREATKGEL